MATDATSPGYPYITVYHNPVSIHVQYACIVLEELNVPYKKEHTELPFDNLKPEFARINPKMGLPALVTKLAEGKPETLTDSRDIINWCRTLPGGERMHPAGKDAEIAAILDEVYGCNGGQLSFQAYMRYSALFDNALALLGKIRTRRVKGLLEDHRGTDLEQDYVDCLARIEKPGPSYPDLLEACKANILSFDRRLEASSGEWLTGDEFTAADAVVAVWLQWVTWSKSGVPLTPRLTQFLEKAQKRPSWTRLDPGFAPEWILTRLQVATGVLTLFPAMAAVAAIALV
mmetsp:Transcript_20826/g.49460  ORF Transcript_20826/g.49460 Transcript_20826/m.49460 type:complete len:288 (+) Transcript_20826:28-891(+)